MSYLGISRLNWLCVVFIFDRHGEHCQAWWKSCYDLRVFLLSCIYKLTKGYLNETIYIWCCLCLHCLLRRADQLPTGISNHCIGREWSIIVWYLFQNWTSTRRIWKYKHDFSLNCTSRGSYVDQILKLKMSLGSFFEQKSQ